MTNRAVASLVFSLGVSLALLTGCSGGGSNSSGTTTTPPAATIPTVTAITPATIPAGSAATAITVTGTGFSATTSIQLAARPARHNRDGKRNGEQPHLHAREADGAVLCEGHTVHMVVDKEMKKRALPARYAERFARLLAG